MEKEVNITVKYKGKKPSLKDIQFKGVKFEGDKVIHLKLGKVKFEKVS